MTNNYFWVRNTFLLIVILCLPTKSYGYEVETHKELSAQAVSRSILANYDFTNFGLSSSSDGLFAEGLKCNSSTPTTNSSLGWIQEGSDCEDDTFTQVFARYKHHFYDFQHNGKGFGGILKRNSGLISGVPAPDWVLDMGPADGQLYSFSQGRQYFYKALTATGEAERKANLARMFRTLGDVMHIMQDMAQPQHTRNDSHGLPSSWYEVYTDKLREKNRLIYGGATATPSAAAREYFTDLAKFSSTNFVSAGTNFDEATQLGYNLPVPGTPTDEQVHTLVPAVSPEILAECDPSKPCIMTFYPTNHTVENKRASARSIFDQYLGQKTVTYTEPVTSTTYTTNRVFTLNSYTFDTALPILIPRAVAYSAGILDYFFRGQIDMAPDTANPGKYIIKNLGTEDMVGDFALYYDAADGNRYPVPGAAWSNLTVSANSQVNNLSFASPVNPAPQTPGEFTLVFSGTMGAEQAGHNSLGVASSSIGAVVAKKVVPKTYATWDTSIQYFSNFYTSSNGELTITAKLGVPPGYLILPATISKSAGKWYWEISIDYLIVPDFGPENASVRIILGIVDYGNLPLAYKTLHLGSESHGWSRVYSSDYGYVPYEGKKFHSGTFESYGTEIAQGDVIGFALDMDSGTLTTYKNGVSEGVMYTGITGSIFPAISVQLASEDDYPGPIWTLTTNFGQSAFAYSVPSGYNQGLYE